MSIMGNQNALTHRASSERQVVPLARNHKRRVLRQLGISCPASRNLAGRLVWAPDLKELIDGTSCCYLC